jgi:hypothetical protein
MAMASMTLSPVRTNRPWRFHCSPHRLGQVDLDAQDVGPTGYSWWILSPKGAPNQHFDRKTRLRSLIVTFLLIPVEKHDGTTSSGTILTARALRYGHSQQEAFPANPRLAGYASYMVAEQAGSELPA